MRSDSRDVSAAEGQRLLAGLTTGLTETLQCLLDGISAAEPAPNDLAPDAR
jgi:hypothetical protein